MNIFAFDPDPVLCAQWLDNKRVGKLLMEANQMMSVAILYHNKAASKDIGMGGLCKPTHESHPVTLWVGRTYSNFQWTLDYACALRDEYAHRYNGTIHGSAERIPVIESWKWVIPGGKPQSFQNSARHGGLDLDFTHLPVHEAYKAYVNARWAMADNPPAWTNRKAPEWYNEQA